MFAVSKCAIPDGALTRPYAAQHGVSVDCYKAEVCGDVSLEEFVGRFYRGRLFKMERWLIEKVVGATSSEEQLENLLQQKSTKFSAWAQIAREPAQMIMRDYQGKTCSWFMTAPHEAGTTLYFGSIVNPDGRSGHVEGVSKMIFTLLLPLHGLYSRLLLSQAAKRFR